MSEQTGFKDILFLFTSEGSRGFFFFFSIISQGVAVILWWTRNNPVCLLNTRHTFDAPVVSRPLIPRLLVESDYCKHFTFFHARLVFFRRRLSFPTWIPSLPSSSRPVRLLLHCKTSKYCFPETLLWEELLWFLFIPILAAIHSSFMSREEDSCTLMRYGLLFGLVSHFVQRQWSSCRLFLWEKVFRFIRTIFIERWIKGNMTAGDHAAAIGTHSGHISLSLSVNRSEQCW